MSMERDMAVMMRRLGELERRVAGMHPTPSGDGNGIQDAFLGKVVRHEYDICTVVPMVYGDPNDWATAAFETEEVCGVWKGNGQPADPDVAVVCLKLANASRYLVIPLTSVTGWTLDDEFFYGEPDDSELADPATPVPTLPDTFEDINCPGE